MTQPFDPTRELAVVIMAGGAGTRFWPLSTEERPKQFLRLYGERTMLQRTADRLIGLVPPERILVITNARYVGLVRAQLPMLPADNVVGEPMARDTAAAIGLAAAICAARWDDPVMAVFTADHRIEPVELFQRTLLSAARAARASGALYTYGIAPRFPATGYGYLEAGAALDDDDGVEHFELATFREKPDLSTARQLVSDGRHSWNSGMFVWTTAAIRDAIRTHLPEHARHLEPLIAADRTDGWEDALRTAFEPLPRISIDYGLMEKADGVRMVRATFEWSDVGDWLALEGFHAPDPSGNRGSGRIRSLAADRNSVFCEDGDEVVALVGVRDLIVVRAGNRTLVTHRTTTEDVKRLVEQMRDDGEI